MIQSKWLKGTDDLRDVIDIRMKVFVEEQGVPAELEKDEIDDIAYHVLVFDRDLPAATGRLYFMNGHYYLGRVAVLKELRGKGLGDLVVRMILLKAFEMGADEVHIHAQLQARGFYEKYGFEAYGEEYEEAGIPHVSMKVTRDTLNWNKKCRSKS